MPLATDSGINANLYPDAPSASSGTATAAGTQLFSLNTTGYASVVLQVSGAFWNGSIVIQQSADGIAWSELTDSNTITGNGLYQFPVIGLYIRATTGPDFNTNGGLGISWVALLRDAPMFTQSTLNASAPLVGTDSSGVSRNVLTDSAGALRLSDGAGPFIGIGQALGQILMQIETTGFNSISVHLLGTFSASCAFYASNDGLSWMACYGFISGQTTSILSSSSASIVNIPAIARYFKIAVSSYTSGMPIAVAYLRNQPVVYNPINPASNIGQIAGYATINAGLNGVISVGGNTAVGLAPTTNPLNIGGWDDTGLTRRLRTDANGDLRIAGPGQFDLNGYPLKVANAPSDSSGIGATECLNLIYAQLKYLSYLIKELPFMLNSGNQFQDEENPYTTDPSLFN